MITLYQFHRIWGLPNASPYCMKLETYLRMTKLAYKVKYINNPRQAPKGKLPYIQIEDSLYADSELIIDELKKRFGNSLDEELTTEQKALAHLIDATLSERMYWIIVYWRWQDVEGWTRVKEDFFAKLPSLPRLLVPYLIRKKMLEALYTQGMGRHTRDEIIHLGQKTIEALAELLGSNMYFLGDKPSSIDASAFAFIANVLMTPIENPLQELLQTKENLTSYCERMRSTYYSDLK